MPNHQALAKSIVECEAKQVIQINNRNDISSLQEGSIQYLPMDARKTSFEDNKFDVVFSASVLEHLLDMDVFLDEMLRILRPGGILCLHGGAFWNSAWGHHLWVHVDDQGYEFNGNNPLPDWSHLTMNPAEMKDFLLKLKIINKHVEKIIDWVYNSDEIHRFTYDDYVKSFNESSFDIVSLVPKNWKLPNDSLADQLREKYGSKISNFSIGEAVVVLRK